MAARLMNSTEVTEVLRNPPVEEEDDEADDEDEETSDFEEKGKLEVDWPHTLRDDVLAVDSDEDDEDGEPFLPLVRPSARPLVFRHVATKTKGSQPKAAARPPAQPAESRRTPTPRYEQSPHDRVRATDGHDCTIVKPTRAAGQRGVKMSESSKTHRKKTPWMDAIESMAESASQVKQRRTPHASHPGLAGIAAAAGLDQETTDDYAKAMQQARQERDAKIIKTKMSTPLFGHGKENDSAGSRLYYDLLTPDLAESIFDKLKNEVDWQRMYHLTGEVPRLVCCQGDVDKDGSMPVYRHPSDQSLPLQTWTPAVERVRKAAEAEIGHPLNHALIQLYRSGNDYISEHSDKTLDIVKGSSIINVSFGAQRTMRLRTKRAVSTTQPQIVDTPSPPGQPRQTYRVPVPHNSMITMSLATNAEYLHGINADKRPSCELNEAETVYGGERISLTFRHIGTFLDAGSTKIWGQGAVAKSQQSARAVVNGDAAESERFVKAFGMENQSGGEFEWERIYGGGFDVLNIK